MVGHRDLLAAYPLVCYDRPACGHPMSVALKAPMHSSDETGQTVPLELGEPVTATDVIAAVPSHVGRYRFRSLLGEGGFGGCAGFLTGPAAGGNAADRPLFLRLSRLQSQRV